MSPVACDVEEDVESQDSDYDDPSEGRWEDLIAVKDSVFFKFLKDEMFTPIEDEAPTIDHASFVGSLTFAKRQLKESIERELKNCLPQKEWYYRNELFWEVESWCACLVEVARAAAKSILFTQFLMFKVSNLPKSDGEPGALVYNFASFRIKVAKWLLAVYVRIRNTEWRIPPPDPAPDSRPILSKLETQELYGKWKAVTLPKLLEIVDGVGYTSRGREAENKPESDSGKSFQKGWEEARECSKTIINYPDLWVDDPRTVLKFPKKEIPGSGIELAKSLKILPLQHVADTFPSKYASSTPQVGDVPRGFPDSFNKFSNADIFWLVAFYNDTFALEVRDTTQGEHAREHLFKVWWHLSSIAAQGIKKVEKTKVRRRAKKKANGKQGQRGE